MLDDSNRPPNPLIYHPDPSVLPSGSLQPHPRRPPSPARQPGSHHGPRIIAKMSGHRLKNGATYANIDTTSPRTAPKMPQPALPSIKNLSFPFVFNGFWLSSRSIQITQTSSQHALKTSQVEPKMAVLAPVWPILGATCCQLGPNFGSLRPSCAHLRPKFIRNFNQSKPKISKST